MDGNTVPRRKMSLPATELQGGTRPPEPSPLHEIMTGLIWDRSCADKYGIIF